MSDSSGNPQYGQRLVPVIVDERAQKEPHRPWGSMPLSSNLADGFKTIDYGSLANAINRAAHWLDSSLEKPKPFETCAYIGSNDFRYYVLMVAAVKTGRKILFTSPRNSLSAHLNLFDKTECSTLLYSSTYKRTSESILNARSLNSIQVPELDEFFGEEKVPDYPYRKSFAEARREPLVVLHTSGSTGLPKPIVLKHGLMATIDAHHLVGSLGGRDTWFAATSKVDRIYVSMPPFHAAGLFITVGLGTFWGVIVVYGPADRPVSPDLINSVLDTTGITAAMIAPSMLDEMSKIPECISRLEKLDSCSYGGGALSHEAGEKLSKSVKIVNGIGATEVGLPLQHHVDEEDWEYFCYNPDYNGFEWRESEAGEDVYEQVIVRKPELDLFQGVFQTFPNIDEWSLKDLYSKHPTKANHWLYRGRDDDIIVFLNGEKINPVTIEGSLRAHPQVLTALVVGVGRMQPAVIIELSKGTPEAYEEREQLIDEIWPTVVEANKESVAHGHIDRHYIMLATPEKPFFKAAKGSIQRPLTVNLYKEEIDQLYEMAESASAENMPKLDISSYKALLSSLRAIVQTVLADDQLADEMDIFAAGADSLQVLSISRSIKGGLSAAKADADVKSMGPRNVYSNPSIKKLTGYIFLELQHRSSGTSGNESHIPDMTAMFEKYMKDLPPAKPLTKAKEPRKPYTVILTGSTGSMGSYMLDVLMHDPNVSHVYCLNRAKDGEKRQEQSSESRGLPASWQMRSVHFLHADLAEPHFGLDDRHYHELLEHTSYIIHNQWQVDFNLSLSSFEPHVRGVRRLIDFCNESSNNPPILFTSTIATTLGWTGDDKVPETLLDDWSLTHGGYGEGKLVASRLLDAAGACSGVRASVVRVGQVSGPVVQKEGGMWNKQEWFPTIIASSLYLGKLPTTLGAIIVDFVPVDLLARSVVELANPDLFDGVKKENPTKYFHTVNPHNASWADLVPVVQEFFTEEKLEEVSMKEWVRALEDSANARDVDVKRNPGIKLLDFYQGLAAGEEAKKAPTKLDTQLTVKASETLRNLEPVGKEWMRTWLTQWQF